VFGQIWLLANYYVGLRSEEWWSAELVESRRLRVRNAKASQNRTFGTHRTLLLDSFTDEEMQVILEFLAIVARSHREPSMMRVENGSSGSITKSGRARNAPRSPALEYQRRPQRR
jgi:hypothetical protein